MRLVAREVAEQYAAGASNSSTEAPTGLRIVRSQAGGLEWTAFRTPQGLFRTFSKSSQGLVVLDAEQTARNLRQIDQPLKVAPGLQITDNIRWRLLKKHFLIDLQDPVGITTPQGVRIMVPYLKYKGIFVRRPVLGGVFVVSPDGAIEDLSPAEAARRPELAATGRIYPDTLARRVQDSYAYKRGILNRLFVHTDQTQVTDTSLNQQPYLIDFKGGIGAQWVTVAEPYGRTAAAAAIFLTDATSGRTRIWKVPQGMSLSGNQKALDSVRGISIPGVDFGEAANGTGSFRVVEPRPAFVRGRLVYVTSVIPIRASTVSKTVVVDAQTTKPIHIFDNEADPNAEAETRRYLATGQLPAGSADTDGVPGATGTTGSAGVTGAAGTSGAAGAVGAGSGATGAGSASGGSVDAQLDRLLRRQRELLRDTEALQRAIARERAKG